MLDSKKYKTKSYTHFDHRIKFERVKIYVTDSSRVAKHSFLPFIYYSSSFERHIGRANSELNYRPIDVKVRDIMYAGHLDNYIYKYYAEMLNCKYNFYTKENNIDRCSTAYRNNKEGQSNIEFAAEVINEIVKYEDAYIMVGDFTKFFDKIDHKVLKKQLLKVLDVNRLENDWFNVYKSITKFGYYEKTFIIDQLKKKEQYTKNMKSYFKSVKQFRKFQRIHSC